MQISEFLYRERMVQHNAYFFSILEKLYITVTYEYEYNSHLNTGDLYE